jgi:hypothetical protein
MEVDRLDSLMDSLELGEQAWQEQEEDTSPLEQGRIEDHESMATCEEVEAELAQLVAAVEWEHNIFDMLAGIPKLEIQSWLP